MNKHPIRILLLSLALAASAHAELSPTTGCDTPLGISLERIRVSAVAGESGQVSDDLLPIMEYARDHRDLLEEDGYGGYVIYGITSSLSSELKRLEKNGCIDEVTRRYYSAAASKMKFTSYEDLSVDNKVTAKWKPIRQYLLNKDHYDRLVAERNTDPEYAAKVANLDKLLKKLYDREMPSIGRVSVRQYLLMNFTRRDINLIAKSALERIEVATSPTGKAVFTTMEGKTLEYDLSLGETANFAANLCKREVEKQRRAEFRTEVVKVPDSVVAAYLMGKVPYSQLEVFLTYADMKEGKERFYKDIANLTWGAAKVVLYAHPVTMPFITLGALIFDSVERKKLNEKALSDEALLIH